MSGPRSVKPARKARLGQNFLVDPHAAERIVAALGAIGDRLVIEIGPGHGALTRLLARTAGRLAAIEFDRGLAAELRDEFAKRENVEIIEADVLRVDFSTLAGAGVGTKKAKVAGNLPYYITTDILLKLWASRNLIETMVIMVQREVAERIAGAPGTRDYGLLSVTAQLFCRVENLFTLPPEAFRPPPKVHSSVLRLTMEDKSAALNVEAAPFLKFARSAFAQKRKTIANNLKREFPGINDALEELEVRPDARAEALTLEQLAGLYQKLKD